MKITKKILLNITVLTFLSLPIVALAAVNPLANLKQATPSFMVQKGELPKLIGDAIKVILGLVGVALLVLTIYAGFLWGTSAGDDEKVKKAKTIIRNSVIGMVIIFAAYAITRYILKIAGINQ